MDPRLLAAAQKAGIHFMGVSARLLDRSVAFDAQPELVTTSNAGIPQFLSTFIDPKLIEILIAPNKATVIVGREVKKGDWTTTTALFPVVESTGEVSSYGDYSNEGKSGANTNFPERQSYHYQTVTQWGEKELAVTALAKIDWANRQNIASVSTLGKYQNKTYFYGVDGLKLYGLLNDPTLNAPIAPINVSGAITWDDKDALGIYGDFLALFKQLQTQTGNNSLIDMESPLTVALSSGVQPNLGKVTQYNVSVMDMVKKNFPNLRIETAPEYATASGNLVQMIADDIEGQETAITAFTEKLRAHPVVVDLSSFRQKKSQGTFGTIIFQPTAIAQMLGV